MKIMKLPLGLKTLLFLSCISIILTPVSESIRYTKYVLVVPAFLLVVLNFKKVLINKSNIELNRYLITYLKLYLFMIAFSFLVLLMKNDFYLRFLSEAVFILSPILLIYFYFTLGYLSYTDKILNIYFWSFILSYIITFGSQIFNILLHPILIFEALKSSTLGTESTLAFIFALFTIHYFHKKKNIYALTALIFTIISFKRIALLALIFSLIIEAIITIKNKNILKRLNAIKYLGIVVNFLSIISIYLLSIGYFDQIISKWLGETANAFTNGRKFLYGQVISQLKPNIIIGTGLGKASEFLGNFVTKVNLLHSDLLKVFIEFGSIVFIIWIITLFNINSKSKKLLILFVFLNILFLTDNVMIYFNVTFIFYLIQCSSIIDLHKVK